MFHTDRSGLQFICPSVPGTAWCCYTVMNSFQSNLSHVRCTLLLCLCPSCLWEMPVDIRCFLVCALLAHCCCTQSSDSPLVSSLNGVQLLQLAFHSSALYSVHWGKLWVLTSVEFHLFICSRVVNRFASCVGVEPGTWLICYLQRHRSRGICGLPAGSWTQSEIYLIALSQTPLCPE